MRHDEKALLLFQCTGGLPQQIPVLVVTGIVAVRLVSAWTTPGLKGVPGVAQVLAVVCGLAYRLEVKVKVLTQLLFGCLQGDALLGNLFLDASKLIVIGSGLLL
jgi:hypothetical protein